MANQSQVVASQSQVVASGQPKHARFGIFDRPAHGDIVVRPGLDFVSRNGGSFTLVNHTSVRFVVLLPANVFVDAQSAPVQLVNLGPAEGAPTDITLTVAANAADGLYSFNVSEDRLKRVAAYSDPEFIIEP